MREVTQGRLARCAPWPRPAHSLNTNYNNSLFFNMLQEHFSRRLGKRHALNTSVGGTSLWHRPPSLNIPSKMTL